MAVIAPHDLHRVQLQYGCFRQCWTSRCFSPQDMHSLGRAGGFFFSRSAMLNTPNGQQSHSGCDRDQRTVLASDSANGTGGFQPNFRISVSSSP